MSMLQFVLEEDGEGGLCVHFSSLSDEGKPQWSSIPVCATHVTPLKREPVLVMDPSGIISQDILDGLMRNRLPADQAEWFDYYRCRRADQKRFAKEIAEADKEFRNSSGDVGGGWWVTVEKPSLSASSQ